MAPRDPEIDTARVDTGSIETGSIETAPIETGSRPRSRWTRRIRARVVIVSVLLVASSLAVVIAVTRQSLLDRLDRQIESALVQEVEELRLLAGGTDPETGEAFGDDVRAIFEVFLQRSLPADHEAFYTLIDGRPFLYSIGAPTDLLASDDLVARWWEIDVSTRLDIDPGDGSPDVRSLAVPLRDADGGVAGVFVIAYFPGDELDEIAQTVRVLMWTALAAVAASALVAWSVAGRVITPVRELTRAARSVTDGDLTRRIPVDGADELAELGHTFNEMVDRLERGFTGQREFLDDVAHELRTPITIARGHLDLLGDDPDEVRETVALVDDELERMSRYVGDLLTLAKAEQPDFLRPELVDLREVVDDVLTGLAAMADRRWVRDDGVAPGVALTTADPQRLHQALLNLATNAVQHTELGAEIGVGVTVDDRPDPSGRRVARLHVRDTGPGVDPDLLATMFRRSHRGATSRVRRPDGTGIGLSIVDAIARAHGGAISVDSVPGHGATFTLVVPLDLEGPATDEIPLTDVQLTDVQLEEGSR